MRKEERDRMMTHMTQEQRAEFRGIVSELRAEMKATPGRRVTVTELLEARKVDVPPLLHEVVEALKARDDMGPKVGEPAPDFCLKRLGSEERVRLSSFQGRQPVAMVFGSYT
jgi:hypothetical protein